MNRISSLDGFRAISIILVVFSHFRFLDDFPEGLAGFAKQFDVGVTVFFVISGFLITTLLLKEYEKDNTISIKEFYIKRAFRILPVFLLYFLLICCLNYFRNIEITPSNFLHAITFTANFDQNKNWFIGHFWTLSIEEQFYLFWPLTLLFFKRNIKLVILFLIIYSWFVRVVVYKFHLNPSIFLHPFFSISDSILIGALTAVLKQENPKLFTNKIFRYRYLQILALLIIILFVYSSAYGKLAYVSLPFGNTIIAICIMYIILSYIYPQNNLIFKFLNHRVMVHIGVLSYSIYIWQEFFFTKEALLFNKFPLNIIAIYLISTASYYLWEKPFLNLRKRVLQKQFN
ncbi:MAG: acyltransferase [Pedobacter sp.]|uniref:acyltransferase family protein n=1 Tax=Pedobacter sp. TaxID=1411316 RepID=UPI0035681152